MFDFQGDSPMIGNKLRKRIKYAIVYVHVQFVTTGSQGCNSLFRYIRYYDIKMFSSTYNDYAGFHTGWA